ncbi:MAG: hypothetical protein DMD96_06950 [Candidatus Rokuibacteriota bacterium]|nr:MAG: hypothetical protein DMD96_06950 [Candidatus Rokubacteria bacterium]
MDPNGFLGWLEIDEHLRRVIMARDAARRAARASFSDDDENREQVALAFSTRGDRPGSRRWALDHH